MITFLARLNRYFIAYCYFVKKKIKKIFVQTGTLLHQVGLSKVVRVGLSKVVRVGLSKVGLNKVVRVGLSKVKLSKVGLSKVVRVGLSKVGLSMVRNNGWGEYGEEKVRARLKKVSLRQVRHGQLRSR